MKIFLLLSLFLSLANATPFLLTKIQSVYPLVEIYSKHVPKSYIPIIKKELIKATNELKIKNDGYSSRPLVIMITDLSIDGKDIIKVELMMGEEVKRLDDGEEVFAMTYTNTDILELEDMDADVRESVEFLLDQFKDQYKEDNE